MLKFSKLGIRNYFYNDEKYTLIDAGSGEDKITIYDSYNNYEMINGGDGDDTIGTTNVGDYVTIIGGAGNDSIVSGKDPIFSYSINIIDNISHASSNGCVDGGSGNDTIKNSLMIDSSITGGTGDDYIENVGSYKSRYTGSHGNSPISTTYYGDYVTMHGGDGNDYIYNTYNIIDTNMGGISDGDNTIAMYGRNVMILGGDGNDTIETGGGSEITLNGSNGDDILIGSNEADIFVYNSGNDTIQNYNSNDKLIFDSTYTGWKNDVDDLIINAAEGSVRINNSKNKLVEVADAAGNLIAYIFIANNYEGILDGRGFTNFEIINGADNVANQIYAGSGGSSLYGGKNSNDELYGGASYDEFIYCYGNGQDNIFNASAEDAVNLNGVRIEQITRTEITDGGVNLGFTDGGALNINGQVGTFILSGQRFGADYQNKSWYAK